MAYLFLWFCKLQELLASAEETPWEYTEEPHTSRRKEILRRHPEIKQLMGYDPSITWIVFMEILIQLVMCWLVQDLAWGPLFIVAYVISGTLNHSLGSAIHEIGHNLAYGHGHPLYNRVLENSQIFYLSKGIKGANSYFLFAYGILLASLEYQSEADAVFLFFKQIVLFYPGMLCNLPMGIPLSVTFKKYHSGHHRFIGDPKLDIGVPIGIEYLLFRHPLTRIIWLILNPIIHGIRPFIKKPEPITRLEIINIVVQLLFDAAIFQCLGVKSLLYFIGGTMLGLGLHPLVGHFISEHYFLTKGPPTQSYYGPLNPILFNAGYHVEHHDFPYIAWNKLPDVKRIAPEFYDHLPHHTSLIRVLLRFILDPGLVPQGHGIKKLKADLDEMPRSTKMINTAVNANNMNGVIMKACDSMTLLQNVNLDCREQAGRVGHEQEHGQ